MYDYTPAQHKEIDKQVAERLATGCIKPSSSPWSSSVVLVQKKDGSWRFAIDYRGLNKVTKTDVFPLPRIQDTLNKLGTAKYFTTLDLTSGYWQLELSEEDREKTAFKTQKGLWEWNRMPMGLKNAGSSFQRMMHYVIGHLEGKSALVYLDDVIVYSDTFDQHLIDLEQVLSKLAHANLTCKLRKCFFAQHSVEYLGHTVSQEGIGPTSTLVNKIVNCPQPNDIHELRTFLGLSNYYRDMIENYSIITAPLTQLLHKTSKYDWTEQCETAFRQIKQVLTSRPLLRHPDFGKPFTLHCDARVVATGAVLTQVDDTGKEHPVRYISKKLTKAQRNYSIGELECLAVIVAIRECRRYLAGSTFTVVTDHKPLVALLGNHKEHRNTRLTRWALELQQYDFNIIHRAGNKHTNADAMSRPPICNLTVPLYMIEGKFNDGNHSNFIERIKTEQRREADLTPIFEMVENDTMPQDTALHKYLHNRINDFIILDDTLYHLHSRSRHRTLVVGNSFRTDALRMAHELTLEGGHRGIGKTFARLQ